MVLVLPGAVDLLIRHFVIETNLVNFIIRNTDVDTDLVTLRPTALSGLGDQAVVERRQRPRVLIALDKVRIEQRDELDFTQLDIPRLDAEGHVRRITRLDI